MNKKIVAIRKDVEEKIAEITNKVATAFYKDNDSIAMMEEGKELVSAALL